LFTPHTQGLQTATDARFYQISAAFEKEVSNVGTPLVIQYEVKHEQNIDCGGGYVKLLPAGLDQKAFNGDSDYSIMFGPDICGSTKRVHVIFNYKGKNHLLNKEIPCESDALAHLYTLVVSPDNTYRVLVDNVEKQAGSLKDDWDMLAPREINDPNASKPSDWDDRVKIDDPEDKKPAGWDDVPAQIKDASATKPDDWDDELDGEWEAPLIDNPEYKGEWRAKQIDNPAYKGAWVHPKVPNPDFVDDNSLGQYKSHKFIGIEIWQVKSGTLFDDFYVGDSVDEAKARAEKWLTKAAAEKEAKEKADEEERKKAEAAAAAEKKDDGAAEGEHDHDHDDHDHDAHDEL
jgi:calreticulin